MILVIGVIISISSGFLFKSPANKLPENQPSNSSAPTQGNTDLPQHVNKLITARYNIEDDIIYVFVRLSFQSNVVTLNYRGVNDVENRMSGSASFASKDGLNWEVKLKRTSVNPESNNLHISAELDNLSVIDRINLDVVYGEELDELPLFIPVVNISIEGSKDKHTLVYDSNIHMKSASGYYYINGDSIDFNLSSDDGYIWKTDLLEDTSSDRTVYVIFFDDNGVQYTKIYYQLR